MRFIILEYHFITITLHALNIRNISDEINYCVLEVQNFSFDSKLTNKRKHAILCKS
jgi:hypothetical protein